MLPPSLRSVTSPCVATPTRTPPSPQLGLKGTCLGLRAISQLAELICESCISESGQSHTYGKQRVTHCVRGVRRRVWDGDESRRPPAPLLTGDESAAFRFFFPPCSASTFSSKRRSAAFPPLLLLSFHSVPCPALALDSARTESSSRTDHHPDD